MAEARPVADAVAVRVIMGSGSSFLARRHRGMVRSAARPVFVGMPSWHVTLVF
jgi:hypothetical protein